MKKYLMFLIGLCVFSTCSIASSNKAIIKIVFSGVTTSNKLGLVKIESINIVCPGESTPDYPYGYIYKGSTFDNWDTLSLEVSGPFDGDDRNTCKIYYDDGSYDKVYYTLGNIVVLYYKNGNPNPFTCSIAGVIGTGRDKKNFQDDKLQAQYRNIEKSCVSGPSASKDSYIITPGHTGGMTYNPGQITINLK